MCRITPLLAFSIWIISLSFFACQPDTDPVKEPVVEGPTEKEQEIAERYEQEFEMTRDPALNIIPRDRLLSAMQYTRTFFTRRDLPADISWDERGPNNVGGRTRALIFDLNDPDYSSMFAGGVAGGLWKTDDIYSADPAWVKVDDFFDNLAINTIVQDPTTPSILYFGTGEGFSNSDAVKGNGIWKSTDGGTNWAPLASTKSDSFDYVNKLVVTSAGHILAATRSSTSANGGIYRSTDGGVSWTKVEGGDGAHSAVRGADIEIAANGDIYASLGIAYDDGIYKSTDGGATFTRVYESGSLEERIELACAPSDSDIVLALVENQMAGGVPPILKSTDGGASWDTMPTPLWRDQSCSTVTDWTRGQDWYDIIAAFHPTDPDIILIGGVDLFKSTNGGMTWDQVSHWYGGPFGCTHPYVHADQHIIAWHPMQPDTIVVGNDGGVHLTMDGTTSWDERNDDYNVTQFYSCAVHPASGSDYMLGGTQDNGTQLFYLPGISSTIRATGGDGGFCHIDQTDPMVQITAFTGNRYSVSTDGGFNFSLALDAAGGSFITPNDYDNQDDKLYARQFGGTYLRWNDPATAGGDDDSVSVAAFSGSSVTAVTVSPNVPHRVWFGLANGDVVYVDDANTGLSKEGVRVKDGPFTNISSIDVEKGDEEHILVTVSNYGVESVFETRDGGATWEEAEGDLPDMPVRWGMFNPNDAGQAILATETGVWSTNNLKGAATNWEPTNIGLANVRCDMIQLRDSDNTVAVGTHGRGMYTTTDFNLGFDVLADSRRDTFCSNSDTAYLGFMVDYVGAFAGTVDLGIANVPAGMTAALSSGSVNADATEILTIYYGSIDPGRYVLDLLAHSGGDTVRRSIGILVLVDGSDPVSLVSPPDNATDIGFSPDFYWASAGPGTEYYFQMSPDSFGGPNLIADTIGNDTAYDYTGTLMTGTTYHWRVKSSNVCGTSPWSSSYSFTTGTIVCDTIASPDVPLSTVNGFFVVSDLDWPDSGTIVDVGILGLDILHNAGIELLVRLEAPSGKTVLIFTTLCGPIGPQYLLNFGDEGLPYGSIPCSPPIDSINVYQPFGQFSSFAGEEAFGNWDLQVADLSTPTTGTLQSWSMKVCVVGPSPPAVPCPDSLLITSSGISGLYEAAGSITVGPDVTITGDVTLSAPDDIDILGEFDMLAGKTLTTESTGCGQAPPPPPPVQRIYGEIFDKPDKK